MEGGGRHPEPQSESMGSAENGTTCTLIYGAAKIYYVGTTCFFPPGLDARDKSSGSPPVRL